MYQALGNRRYKIGVENLKTLSNAYSGIFRLLILTLAAENYACSLLQPTLCTQGQHEYASELLYFGSQSPQGEVTADQWSDFLDKQVTPFFPDGLSVFRAAGQWHSEAGTLVRENSFVLNLIHPDNAADDNTIRRIMAAYKTRFKQESVLRVKSQVCTEFQ